ncbi:GNAT family N-acetyltransferase [Aurantivibrio infirmus]
MSIKIISADYQSPQHAKDMGFLLNQYALDPMGGNAALPGEITENLAHELAKRSYAFTVLAYVEDKPAGMVNCFEAYSTFEGKPLVNIHDVVVLKGFRGLKLSIKMLDEVEKIATERGCCKLTLEVLSGNHIAKSAYQKFGFASYILDPKKGEAVFWQKKLSNN